MSNDIINAAAAMDKTFGFTGAVEITGASARHAHLFESMQAITPTVGKAVTAGSAITMATGSLGLGALGALSVTFHDVFSGGSKPTNSRS